jgi:hypothetical protein
VQCSEVRQIKSILNLNTVHGVQRDIERVAQEGRDRGRVVAELSSSQSKLHNTSHRGDGRRISVELSS